jgi:hypothetical protein
MAPLKFEYYRISRRIRSHMATVVNKKKTKGLKSRDTVPLTTRGNREKRRSRTMPGEPTSRY